MYVRRRFLVVALASAFALAGPASGQASRSLDKCQKEVSKGLGKYLAAKQKVLGNCLSKVGKNVLVSNKAVAETARQCGAQLNKLENPGNPTKTVLAKARAKILKRCDPAASSTVGHTAAQALELIPPVVPQGIQAKELDTWCTYFDFDPNSVPDYADGSLDSVAEWLDCAFAVTECNAHQAIAAQFPRALEWLEELAVALPALGAKFDGAVLAVDRVLAMVDPLGGGSPTINCGPGLDTCGDGVANGTDQCDGADLDDASCASLGFKGGTLGCDEYCYFDFADCVAGAFPATGQTEVKRAGDDGDLQKGAPFNMFDNGNGTISDANSGLMWEKKGRDGGMHDWGITFSWENAFAVHLNRMNNMCDGFEGSPALLTPCDSDADCIGIGNQKCGHAGYRDWRIPNRTELQTLVNMGRRNPSTPEIFDNPSCVSNCTVLTCSCTPNNKYWTSTTYAVGPVQAWYVIFADGDVNYDPKTNSARVRAVRAGGL